MAASVLAAQFFPSESTEAVMTSLAAVLRTEGLPQALYTDRAHWAFHTPKAGGPVAKGQLTQVGRALATLGIEHIPSYTPQARGRSERLNRTVQDRLVKAARGGPGHDRRRQPVSPDHVRAAAQ